MKNTDYNITAPETKCPRCGATYNPNTLCGIKWVRTNARTDNYIEDEWDCFDCGATFKETKYFKIIGTETTLI